MARWWLSRVNKRATFDAEYARHASGGFDCRVYLDDGKTVWTGQVMEVGYARLVLNHGGVRASFAWSQIDYWSWVEKGPLIPTSLHATPPRSSPAPA